MLRTRPRSKHPLARLGSATILFVLFLAGCGGGGSGNSAGASTASALPSTSEECLAKRTEGGYDVVLLAGQSNMAGYGGYYVPSIDKSDPRIKQWGRAGMVVEATEPLEHPNYPFNLGRIGPGLAFARAYLSDLPNNRSVLLVPTAQGGTGFANNRWNPGDNQFEPAVTRTLEALAVSPGNCLAGILWSQGESDVLDRMSEVGYRNALHTMIRAMRTRLARGGSADAIPFVLGQFSQDWTGPVPTADQQAILNAINATPKMIPYSSVVSTDGLTSNITQGLDGAVHFDAVSQRTYGARFRESLKVAAGNSLK